MRATLGAFTPAYGNKMTGNLPHFRIAPGGYFWSKSEVVISTLLGSCLAVCLYDPIRNVVGMNHIMTSSGEHGASKPFCYHEDGKYGFCAMELLIHQMIKKGALLENLRAKVFGGASLFRPYAECSIDYCVGEENVRFAKDYLQINGIPIVAEALGGNHGRLIRFYSNDFSVWVKKIKKASTPKLIQRDNKAWDALSQEK